MNSQNSRIQPGELGLARLLEGQRQLFEVPVVEGAMTVELERAQRVGDPLDRVALAVGPVVGGIDAPQRTSAVMVHTTDAVHHRVTQLHVLVLHVDLGAQHVRPLGELPGAHPSEQVEVLLDGAVPERAVDTGLAVAAALGRDGLAVLVVDVGETLRNKQFGPVVQLLEVVAGIQRFPVDRVAEPGQVGDDAVDVTGVLGVGIGVVEPQIADTVELAGDAEVDGDRLGVADVQVAVGLGREPGLHPAAERALLVVGSHEVAHEVGGGDVGGGRESVGGRHGVDQYGRPHDDRRTRFDHRPPAIVPTEAAPTRRCRTGR